MDTSEEQMKILRQVSQHLLSPEQADRQMEALAHPSAPADEFETPLFRDQAQRFESRRWWWLLLMGVGVSLIVMGAYGMYSGYLAARFSWGFWLSWIPLLLGVLFTYVAVESRHAPWLHVRVHSAQGQQRVAISMPFPLRSLRWITRVLRPFLSEKFREQNAAELLDVMADTLQVGEGMHVLVDDAEDGEHVEIYIG